MDNNSCSSNNSSNKGHNTVGYTAVAEGTGIVVQLQVRVVVYESAAVAVDGVGALGLQFWLVVAGQNLNGIYSRNLLMVHGPKLGVRLRYLSWCQIPR